MKCVLRWVNEFFQGFHQKFNHIIELLQWIVEMKRNTLMIIWNWYSDPQKTNVFRFSSGVHSSQPLVSHHSNLGLMKFVILFTISTKTTPLRFLWIIHLGNFVKQIHSKETVHYFTVNLLLLDCFPVVPDLPALKEINILDRICSTYSQW